MLALELLELLRWLTRVTSRNVSKDPRGRSRQIRNDDAGVDDGGRVSERGSGAVGGLLGGEGVGDVLGFFRFAGWGRVLVHFVYGMWSFLDSVFLPW